MPYFLLVTPLLSYLTSLALPYYYLAQTTALLTLPLLYLIKQKRFNVFFFSLASFIINLIVFTTHGLNSPVFFLIYFLLFSLAFLNPPSVTLAYSLVIIILLSQSLNSVNSLLPLASLLLITPLAYFIGHLSADKKKSDHSLASDETDILLWSALTLKNNLTTTIDICSQLLSSPLSATQRDLIKKVEKNSQHLLKSGQKLAQTVDQATDD